MSNTKSQDQSENKGSNTGSCFTYDHPTDDLCKICFTGACFDKYQIQEELGSGSGGVVYSVYNKEDKKIYAAKLIPLLPGIEKQRSALSLDSKTDTKISSTCATVTQSAFDREVKMSSILSKAKLAPVLRDYFICSIRVSNKSIQSTSEIRKLGIIISDKWDISLREYINSHPSEYKDNREMISLGIESLIDNYIKAGLYHGDLHRGNVVLKLNSRDEPDELTFIDFEEVKALTNSGRGSEIFKMRSILRVI